MCVLNILNFSFYNHSKDMTNIHFTFYVMPFALTFFPLSDSRYSSLNTPVAIELLNILSLHMHPPGTKLVLTPYRVCFLC